MNTELLTDWAEALEALHLTDWERAGFDMNYWALKGRPRTPMLGCGTVCCAYGVGTTLPSWQEARLGFVLGDMPGQWVPPGEALTILGLDKDQWDSIILPESYPSGAVSPGPVSPGDVAKRIRYHLEEARL